MKIAAITITYNRLELTKKMVESFYAKTSVDYHLFVDNGSTDGTLEWLQDYDRIELGENKGIAEAFYHGVHACEGFDYILKLDNDVETVTDDIINKMLAFLEKYGPHSVSPVDELIDPKYYPSVLNVLHTEFGPIEYTSHTGGAFQLTPIKYVNMLCENYVNLRHGDVNIGAFFRKVGCPPVYMKSLSMRHVGLNLSCPNYKL